MRWAMKQRMEFIADRLAKAGRINRRDIMEKFEVSAPQASADFRLFEKEHPGAMRYDSSSKAFIPDRRIARMRDISEAATCLIRADDAQLQLIARRDPSMIRDVAAALIARTPN